MKLGKVIGNVVSTHKDPKLNGQKLLIVEPFDPKTKESFLPIVAADGVGAGNNEIVLYITGSGARTSIGKELPIDAAIVGIVDSIEVNGEVIEG